MVVCLGVLLTIELSRAKAPTEIRMRGKWPPEGQLSFTVNRGENHNGHYRSAKIDALGVLPICRGGSPAGF